MYDNFLAYIDAGTGSLFLQAAIGAVLGAGYMARGFIGKIVGRRKNTADPASEE